MNSDINPGDWVKINERSAYRGRVYQIEAISADAYGAEEPVAHMTNGVCLFLYKCDKTAPPTPRRNK